MVVERFARLCRFEVCGVSWIGLALPRTSTWPTLMIISSPLEVRWFLLYDVSAAARGRTSSSSILRTLASPSVFSLRRLEGSTGGEPRLRDSRLSSPWSWMYEVVLEVVWWDPEKRENSGSSPRDGAMEVALDGFWRLAALGSITWLAREGSGTGSRPSPLISSLM